MNVKQLHTIHTVTLRALIPYQIGSMFVWRVAAELPADHPYTCEELAEAVRSEGSRLASIAAPSVLGVRLEAQERSSGHLVAEGEWSTQDRKALLVTWLDCDANRLN